MRVFEYYYFIFFSGVECRLRVYTLYVCKYIYMYIVLPYLLFIYCMFMQTIVYIKWYVPFITSHYDL